MGACPVLGQGSDYQTRPQAQEHGYEDVRRGHFILTGFKPYLCSSVQSSGVPVTQHLMQEVWEGAPALVLNVAASVPQGVFLVCENFCVKGWQGPAHRSTGFGPSREACFPLASLRAGSPASRGVLAGRITVRRLASPLPGDFSLTKILGDELPGFP